MERYVKDTEHGEDSKEASESLYDPAPAGASSPFPIVALGASAGGLEALRQLFSQLQAKSGMSFVVIQHLDPARPSILTSVLAGITDLPVVEARNDMPAEPDRVHVIPSDSDLAIQGGVLRLMPRRMTGRLHLPIDSFFRSLAPDAKGRAIGVVLSGSGNDGTEGLRAIKAEGGITMAQEPESAQFKSMPESAIAAGVVDFQGDPETSAAELTRLSRHPHVASDTRPEVEPPEPEIKQEKSLARVFSALRRHVEIDFSGYKRTTLLRRIERRMTIRHDRALAEYADALQSDPEEARTLAGEMLIQVTSFFRDPDAFEALKEQVFTELIRRKGTGETIRIWVPGCSTGEEAYALIICLLESMGDAEKNLSIKLFGTDLSEEAIDAARLGVYREPALVDVSPERLSHFFERVEGGHRIGKLVRDLCVFVKHDLTRDPPFAKLDLISCRNVLIYFDAELQRRVVPMLHYCLNPNGYLFLGQSETITGFRDLFTPVDKTHRIFVKTGKPQRLIYPFTGGRESEARLGDTRPPERGQRAREAQRQADHLLLARYSPPGAIVNDRLEIIQFRGRTGAYLEPAPGQPQANLLRMARGGLAAHLHEVVERAKAETKPVRKEGLRVQIGSESRAFDLEVVPLTAIPGSGENFFLVLFEQAGIDRARAEPPSGRPPVSEHPAEELAAETERLNAELVATKDYLQALLSEHQSTTDELAAANEELVAANEELQSTNEELQSAKEELQSTNEELTTVNDELHHRNAELDETATDLVNVLASVEIPVIIVDMGLRVRRFTPAVGSIASFIPEDVGRPIDDLKLKVQIDNLSDRIQTVVDNLSPKDWEVEGNDGRWFRLQIRPYRTSDNRLDGAVLSFVDVDALKRAVRDAENAGDYARSIVETVTSALVILDSDLRVISANEAFHKAFETSPKGIEGRSLLEAAGSIWRAPALRQALDESLTLQKPFNAIELTAESASRGRRHFSASGRPILWGQHARMVLMMIDDVTELRVLEAERALLLESEKQARIEAERATQAKDMFLATLSHELRTPLSTMLMSVDLLKEIAADDHRIERASASIERAVNAQSRLIDDLLDVSRIVSGKLMLDLAPVDFAEVVEEAVDLARPSAKAKSIELDLSIDGIIGFVYGDKGRLLQVVNNLLYNAVKFTPHGGQVWVSLRRADRRAHLAVTDDGMGISADVLPRLFAAFVQADSSVVRAHGGLGLGLSIVRHLVEVHGGEVQADSPGTGKGSTFRVTLPVGTAPQSAKGAVAPRVSARSIQGVRVLLVEDDDDTREAYEAMLVKSGAEVRAEPSAAAGLAALGEFLPDVILSDIAMPGEDGFSFMRKVRSLDAKRGGKVPAAAVTALASDEDRQRALESGFQMHVAKPMDGARLTSVVATLADWKPQGSR